MEFSETLRLAIKAVGLSQTTAAHAVGISQPVMGRYLRGRNTVTGEVYLPREDTLGVIVSLFDKRSEIDAEWGDRLISAWVRSRLGTQAADRVLAESNGVKVRDGVDVFNGCLEPFRSAIESLVAKGRIHKEVREAIIAFAAAIAPVSQ